MITNEMCIDSRFIMVLSPFWKEPEFAFMERNVFVSQLIPSSPLEGYASQLQNPVYSTHILYFWKCILTTLGP